MVKIIVAAPPIPGEAGPLIAVARGLAGRGHQIEFLTGGVMRPAVEAAGLSFVPLGGQADFAVGEPGFDWNRAFIDAVPDQHRALQALLATDPDRRLVANVQFLGALPVTLGAPGRRPRRWVAVSVTPLPISSDDATFLGPAPIAPGQDQRAANRAYNAMVREAMQPVTDRLNDVLRGLGATGTLSSVIDDMYTTPDGTAVLTVPGFEFPRGDLPDNIHLVGLPGSPRPRQRPAGRPVVVVTQGTLANADLAELVEPALTALAGRDVTVVASLGGRDPRALSIPIPDNAQVHAYLPFDTLLPTADVLVTNGGSGGVHQALAAGVPVVVAGATEDKPANAARVAYHRLGVDLATARPAPAAVVAAVDTVLSSEEIRENVRRLAEVYAGHDAIGRIENLALN